MSERIKYDEVFPAEICAVQGKPYLFSNSRIDRSSVHPKLYVYDVRDDSCDGEFWEIQKHVMVDHWGTIIGLEEVELDEFGRYWCPPDPENKDLSSEGHFIGMTAQDHSDYVVWYHTFKSYAEAVGKAGSE